MGSRNIFSAPPRLRGKRFLFLGVLCALAVDLLSACAEPSPDALRMGLASAPTSLDPRHATDATSERINRLLYRRLVELDERGMPVPGLASWERLAPRHYRFVLGEAGREFHDGSRLNAVDVKATYEYVLHPAHVSPHRTTLQLIERIEIPDTETIDFFLKRPDPLFPAYLALGILPARLIGSEHSVRDEPVGSGPFGFVDWPEEGRLILQRRTDGARFEFLHVADPTVRVLKLLRGELDMLQNDLPPELVGWLGEQQGIQIERAPGTNFSYLGFNLEDPATGNIEVRRAIAHALDREAIIRYVMADGARPAQALLPPQHWAGASGLEGYRHDPGLARNTLRRAGYGPDNPLRLNYKTSSDPFRVRLATVIQSQLAAVGIEVDIHSYDWGTFFGDIKAGRFQMYSLAWVGINTPDIFRYVFHSASLPPDGANRGRLRDIRVDGLIERAEALDNIERQAPVYRELQGVLLEELPYIPLWYEDQIFVSREDVMGYRLAADGNYDGLITVRRTRHKRETYADVDH